MSFAPLQHIRRFTRDDLAHAVCLLEELLAHEPNNAVALGDLAFALDFSAPFGWVESPPAAMARMSEVAQRAVASESQDSAAHTALAPRDSRAAQGAVRDGVSC